LAYGPFSSTIRLVGFVVAHVKATAGGTPHSCGHDTLCYAAAVAAGGDGGDGGGGGGVLNSIIMMVAFGISATDIL
jgi:hypothetical protein